MTDQREKKRETFVKYLGWVISIFLAAVWFINWVNEPTEKLQMQIDAQGNRISAVETDTALVKKEHELYRDIVTKQLDVLVKSNTQVLQDVAEIRGALGLKKHSEIISEESAFNQ